MSDRTCLQVSFAACPQRHVLPVLQLLDDYQLNPEAQPRPGAAELLLDEGYRNVEVRCGSADQVAAALRELDGVVFYLWEDPKYEWLGDVHIEVPDAGSFDANCDAAGQPLFTAAEAKARLSAPDPDRALGLAHVEEFEQIRARNSGMAIEALDEDEDEDED